MVEDAGLGKVFQDLANGLEDELAVITPDYRIGFANSALRLRVRGEAQTSRGGLCYEVLQGRDKPCSAPLWDCPLSKVLESGSLTVVVHPIRTLGTDTYFKITAYPLRDSQGNIEAIVELRRDVTAERQLETQILRRHHQLQALSHISSAVSGLRDLDAVLRLALDSVLEIINGTIGGILLLDEATNQLYYRVQRGLSTKYAESMRLHLGEGIAGKVAQTAEAMLLEDISKDPRAARSDLISSEGIKGFVSIPLRVRDKVVGVMNVASHAVGRFGMDDVSLLSSIGDYLGTAIEQARLYQRLAKAAERYQTLLQHALTAQEQERKRIARELHDETSQALTSLALSLQAIIGLAEMKGFNDPQFMEHLKRTQAYTVYAGGELVKLMKELRPTLLDELGLASAMQRYAKDTLRAQGINISVELKGIDRRFPPEVELTLFRAAQGLMGNILEHSGAKNASIRLECDASECVLNIQDDGKGFDVSKLTQVDSSGRGAGLFTIKERVKLLGGACRIESQPGQGTNIVVRVPLTGDVLDEKDKSTNS